MNDFKPLSRDTVISVNSRDECYFEDKIIIVDDALGENCNLKKWFEEGVKCKIMSPDQQGWITGKVRFTMEFEADVRG